jgi:hypothetical protein
VLLASQVGFCQRISIHQAFANKQFVVVTADGTQTTFSPT